MVVLQLPTPNDKPNTIDPTIVHLISINISNVQSLLNFSLLNKSCYNQILNDEFLWVSYLKSLGNWKNPERKQNQHRSRKSTAVSSSPIHHRRRSSVSANQPNDNNFINELNEQLLIIDDEETNLMNPINCLDKKISDSHLARSQFIKIYSILSPITSSMLIKQYTNIQNLAVFKDFNSPLDQSKLFTNILRFLNLYKNEPGYKTMVIRLNAILELFVNTLVREIDLNLQKRKYSNARSLIFSMDHLIIDNEDIQVDPLETLLESFINNYVDSYSFLMTEEYINNGLFEKVFYFERGAVNGYILKFDRIDELFDVRLTNILNDQLKEIYSIFSTEIEEAKIEKDENTNDEVPIVLKVFETFLSSYLIGGFVDKVLSRAKEIDQSEANFEYLKRPEKTQVEKVKEEDKRDTSLEVEEDNVWSNGVDVLADKKKDDQESPPEPKQEEQEQEREEEEEEKSNPRINIMNESSLFFQCIPYIHQKMSQTLKQLKYPETEIVLSNKETAKMDYFKVISGFMNFYYEQYLLEFAELLPRQTQSSLLKLISDWNLDKSQNQKQVEQDILNLVVEDETKTKAGAFDIFTNFTNIFKFSATGNSHNHHHEEETANQEPGPGGDSDQNKKLTKFTANLRILKANVENIKSLISMDLIVLILQNVKNSYELLLGLTKNSTTKELNTTIYTTCSGIFVNTITTIINQHIQPGFNEALSRLKNYNSKSKEIDSTLESEPLTNFIELVNVGDLILQMIEIFYNDELVSSGIVKSAKINGQHRDFLSAKNNQCDSIINKFETILDSYVADGLDISINVIMSEISYAIVDSGLTEHTYNLKEFPDTTRNSTYVVDVVGILSRRFKLLTGSIDKAILDIFKEEIGERFVSILVKLINKRIVISCNGAILFINDLNYLFNFFQSYKIKKTVEYLKSLKKISQLYLIDCSEDKKQCKELGKLVITLGRDNGIFSPEEVYQFTSRRSDWLSIKKSVDKLMYGFGVEDCVIV